MSKQCAPLGAILRVAHARVAFALATLDGVVPIARSVFVKISAGGMVFASLVIAFVWMVGMLMIAQCARRRVPFANHPGR